MNLNYMSKHYPLKCLGSKVKELRYVGKWNEMNHRHNTGINRQLLLITAVISKGLYE